MKNNSTLKTIILILSFTGACCPISAQVGIGTVTPHEKALLEVSSNSKGILFPRMTQTQRQSIADPEAGLLVYQTDEKAGIYYFDGTRWSILSTYQNSSTIIPYASGTEILISSIHNLNKRIGMLGFGESSSPTVSFNAFYLNGPSEFVFTAPKDITISSITASFRLSNHSGLTAPVNIKVGLFRSPPGANLYSLLFSTELPPVSPETLTHTVVWKDADINGSIFAGDHIILAFFLGDEITQPEQVFIYGYANASLIVE